MEEAQVPTTKLGMYTVLSDIAEGTFGKVKSEFILPVLLHRARIYC